jgi:hypothetical protein
MADGAIMASRSDSLMCTAQNGELDDTLPATPAMPAMPALPVRAAEQVVRAPPVSVPVVPLVENCASKLDAVAIALLSEGNSALRVLGAFKAGLDIGECAVKELNAAQTAADHRAAIDQCIAHEGTPLGFVDDTLTCALPPGKLR